MTATSYLGNAVSLVGKPFPNENLLADLLVEGAYTVLLVFNLQPCLQWPPT